MGVVVAVGVAVAVGVVAGEVVATGEVVAVGVVLGEAVGELPVDLGVGDLTEIVGLAVVTGIDFW